MKFQVLIVLFFFILCAITTKSTSKNKLILGNTNKIVSKYKGVTWNKKCQKWCVLIRSKGQKQTYGGVFTDELDAVKRANQVCEELGIPSQNPKISAIKNQIYPQKKQKTSQYKGIYWHKLRKKWYVIIQIQGQKHKYGGYFNDELNAAKRVNQICKDFGILPKNPNINAIPNQEYQVKKENTSQYKGVTWHIKCKKWYVQISVKGEKIKYGGLFNDELHAAKKVNQLCENFGMSPQNPGIGQMSTQEPPEKENKSQYKGVYWSNQRKKWISQVRSSDGKKMFGGYFNDELDAAKKVNQLCEEITITSKNPGIHGAPNEQKRQKISEYVGVYWHKQVKKWYVSMAAFTGGKYKYGGTFHDELDAGKQVNHLCEELNIPLQNPTIGTMPNQPYQKKENSSKYTGVYWNKQIRKWCARISIKGQKQKYGGIFDCELDAAKKVNEIWKDFKMSEPNPMIPAISSEVYKKEFLHDAPLREELANLTKMLYEYNEPITNFISKNLTAAIKYGDESKLAEINLRTQNGESALSIAAKHGLSNAVKFLISKGADKQHFTNEHHTPLSLAVSHNYLNVVQVLFEDWISPNFHEKPFLHLLPIFNVKSREIAQLLIDNDAITHDIYNGKHQSPLTVACQNGYLEVVEFFLDDGLDINHLDNYNKTPFFYALTNKHHNVANLLILKGAIV